ncbi:hypothetical protein GCM10009565_68170 [Amycolatopsis albidoflavus]
MIAKDSIGQQVLVTTGLTMDADGNDVIGVAIGKGPTAALTITDGARLSVNIRSSLHDLIEHLGGV